jgi:hypothetical protein
MAMTPAPGKEPRWPAATVMPPPPLPVTAIFMHPSCRAWSGLRALRNAGSSRLARPDDIFQLQLLLQLAADLGDVAGDMIVL